jgi:hypothetical protein
MGTSIKNHDLLNLREYVTHDTGAMNQAESTVLLMCTHSNLKARFMEIRFDRHVRLLPRHLSPYTSSLSPLPLHLSVDLFAFSFVNVRHTSSLETLERR